MWARLDGNARHSSRTPRVSACRRRNLVNLEPFGAPSIFAHGSLAMFAAIRRASSRVTRTSYPPHFCLPFVRQAPSPLPPRRRFCSHLRESATDTASPRRDRRPQSRARDASASYPLHPPPHPHLVRRRAPRTSSRVIGSPYDTLRGRGSRGHLAGAVGSPREGLKLGNSLSGASGISILSLDNAGCRYCAPVLPPVRLSSLEVYGSKGRCA